MTDSTPGWQTDPTGRHDHRYWDGAQWTDNVSDAGLAGTDPYDAAWDAGVVSAAEAPTVVGDSPVAGPPWGEPATIGAGPGEPTAVSGTPLPPEPPRYTVPPGSPDEPRPGGSKKGLLIGGAILAVVALIAVVALLGGDDDSDRDRIHADVVGVLKGDGGLTDAEADCVADHVIDEVGVDRLKDVDFEAEPAAELQDDLTAASIGSVEACDIDIGSDGGDETTSTFEDAGEEIDSTQLDEAVDDLGELDDLEDIPAEVRDQLVDTYESMGIDRDKAECFTDKIVEGIESGELEEEQAMTEILGYFTDCDIDPSEITGS